MTLYGAQRPADMGVSTVLACMDFETYSPAGYVWDESAGKWRGPPNASQGRKGLSVVGAAVYAERPETEVLSLAYDLHDGAGPRTWRPGQPNPQPLFDHLAAGRLVEAWNAPFEIWIWGRVCTRLYGWPELPVRQVRCTMAKARAAGYPGSLDAAGEAMQLTLRKDKDGKRLLDKFSVPRNPTKADPRRRIRPEDDPEDFARLVSYNIRDIETEAEASHRLPDLSDREQEVWYLDHDINSRGIAIDQDGMADCIAVIEQAFERYNGELQALAGCNASETARLRLWLLSCGVDMESLDEEHVENTLAAMGRPEWVRERVEELGEPEYRRRTYEAWAASENRLNAVEKPDTALRNVTKEAVARLVAVNLDPTVPPDGLDARLATTAPNLHDHIVMRLGDARRALELRALIGSASVKKLYAIRNMLAADGRLHDLFTYHGARTGRWTGGGPQPTNLPTSGPPVVRCGCGRHYAVGLTVCPWCGSTAAAYATDWCAAAAQDALDAIATRCLDVVEAIFGDALHAVAGCLRGLFVAALGHELVSSDYSAIEAVGLAELAGEEWRREVFRTHGKIYEMSAAKISGVPFETFMSHRKETGQHHPLRKRLGKVAELASGYQGWIGAWKAFGADEHMDDEEIKAAILAWRAASPAVVALWGGQVPQLHGLEGMAILAVQNPERWTQYRGIYFIRHGDALFMRLPSGRFLTYRHPELHPSEKRPGQLQLSYMTHNSNPKMGPMGWQRMGTYGGRLTENLDQAACRDVFVNGMLAVAAAGYRPVQHVYDEIAAEVPIGWGSVEEFERLISQTEPWSAEWPVRASGGWRGRRYRKD